MNLSNRMNQTAAVWGSPSPDGYGGYAYASPQTIKCRWESKSEQFRDAAGEQKISHTILYTYDAVTAGDYVALGDYSSSTSTTTTGTNGATFTPSDTAWKAERVDASPPLTGVGRTLYKVYL